MHQEVYALELLENLGVKRGQIVLDFGCGSGVYAIPAARIVGDEGKVYALDKDSEVLDKLMNNAERAGLKNVERVSASAELRIDLPDNSVDAVLLFDVLHSYYFPRVEDRGRLLGEIRRICKAGALILVYPRHMEFTAKDEIEKASLRLESEYSGTVIHDKKNLEKGLILIFRNGKEWFSEKDRREE